MMLQIRGDRMKISVIIPVYNVEKYLERCLESVLNQTHSNLEIILVNDGSRDSSLQICEKYAMMDQRIKVISQSNQGLSAARNTGVEQATGEYIAFLDSDDWLELDAYEYLLDALQRSEVDMIVAGIARTSIENVRHSDTFEEEILTQEQYMQRFFKIGWQGIEYYVCNKLMKASVVKEVQFPVGLTAEDVLATFRYILQVDRVLVSNKVVYNYFRNPQSITATFSEKDFDLETIWDMVVVEAQRSQNLTYIEWAKVNRQRVNLALLMRIAVAGNWRENITNYKKSIDRLIHELQQSKSNLLTSRIPLTRKVFVVLFSNNYYMWASLMNRFRKYLQFMRG